MQGFTMSSIVQADVDDDVSSLTTRLGQVEGDRVAILVPPDNQRLDSPLALRLLRRQAAIYGLELAIVSTHPVVRTIADEEGIPVFSSTNDYARHGEHDEQPSTRLDEVMAIMPERLRSIGGLAFVFTLIALGVGLLLIFLPVATVRVVPVSEVVSGRIDIIADPDAKAPDLATRRVPARTIHLLIERTEQLDITAKQTNGEAKARGVVTFTNRTDKEVAVPAGTVVGTGEGIAFQTTEDVTLPAKVGSNVRVPITAVDPGARGNVPRLRISRIDGPLQFSLSVLNEERTVGGGAATKTIVASADREQVQRLVEEKGRREALARLSAQIEDKEILLADSLTFTVLDTKFDKEIGEEGRALTGRITARASGTVVNADDVEYLARLSFKPKLRDGFVLPTDRVSVKPPELVATEGRLLRLAVPVEGTSYARLNVDRIREYVRWRPSSDAEQVLAADFLLARPPKVEVSPGWIGRAYRVDVDVEPIADESQAERPQSTSSR